MANDSNDPNRPHADHVNHGARRVDIGPERKGFNWLWLLLIPLLALLIWALWPKHHDEQTVSTVEQSSTVSGGDATVGDNAVDVAAAAPTTPLPTAAVPAGSGVVSETRDGRPALIVYFETGKSAVSRDLSAASADVKTYLAAHAGSGVAVSGFNDPTGNAAANAALSKRRAEEVSKALTQAGIPAGSIKLKKPADTTGTGDTNAQARRVEVTVHD